MVKFQHGKMECRYDSLLLNECRNVTFLIKNRIINTNQKRSNMKNLRVAVIPTETGNGIDQSSTVEQILDCPELQLYPLTDYFQAQNDEEINLLHWSFLIDIQTQENLTGTNIEGIHMHTKRAKIEYIKTILERWGEVTATDLELDSSPCIFSQGSEDTNISVLVEEFYPDHCNALTYIGEHSENYERYEYEDLDEDVFAEVLAIIEDYEAMKEQDEKRMRD